ncbi:MAG: YfcE family phosphodiesterase [Filifactor alocis]|nr:YfcE family phosphodiesterase [Filifactor alocis]
MKIGFISDTHGEEYYLKIALPYLSDCDMVLHTGDIFQFYCHPCDPLFHILNSMDNLHFVRGNCDGKFHEGFRHDISLYERVIEYNSLRIFMAHGNRKSLYEYVEEAKSKNCSLLVSGHTHRRHLEFAEGILCLNPGSLGRPRDGSHSLAIMDEQEIRIFDVLSNKILNVHPHPFQKNFAKNP